MGIALEPVVVRRFGDSRYPHSIPDQQSKHLSLFLDGVQSPGVRPGQQLLKTILEQGDFARICYPMKWGFSSTKVADAVLRLLSYDTKYEVVTLIGFSMGGLVACEVADVISCMRPNIKVRLMLMDAPASVDDLYQDVAARFTRLIPAIPTPGWLNRRAFGMNEPAPREAELSKTAKEDLLAHEVMSAEFPFGIFARQTAYIARTKLPKRIIIPTFYVQSINDPIIRTEASRNWGKACEHFARTRVDSPGHGLMLEFPTLWTAAIEEGFQWLNALKV